MELSPRRRITWLDVFTARRYSGNGLAVVHGADGLSEEEMLAFTRETGLTEASFVQTPTADGADYRNRIWMAKGEIPFAGHPSLGAAVAVAHEAGSDDCSLTQQTTSGIHMVEVTRRGAIWSASMLQDPPVLSEEIDPLRVVKALSLAPDQAHRDLPVQLGSAGLPVLLVPLRDSQALASAELSHDGDRTILAATGAIVLYAFVADGARVAARGFFDQGDRIAEDPATGAAAGPLAAYLQQHSSVGEITIEQGLEMGRPSVLRATVEDSGVRVSGDCAIVFHGELVQD